MRKNSILIIGLLGACSCASVKKDTSRIESTSQHTDSSTTQKEHIRTTTIAETAGTPVTTRQDSASVSGYMTAEDTTGFAQQVTAGAVTLNTNVKPRRKNGKTTGYDITASAVKAPEVLSAPVNRQITVSETGKVVQQAAVKDDTVAITSTTDKSVFRLNAAGVTTIVLCLLGAVASYLVYRYFKKYQKK